jgi:hypothetical protein
MKKKILFVILFSVFILQGAIAKNGAKNKKIVLNGFVKDMNNQPIKNAIILTPNSDYSRKTNNKGYYKIKIDSSTKKVMVLTSVNGYIEKDYQGEAKLDFVYSESSEYEYSEDQQKARNQELIAKGYNEDIIYENSGNAIIFNGRKVNPYKYSSFEELLDKEMSPNVYVVSRFGLYIVDGEYIQGVWNLKSLKPTMITSIEIENIDYVLPFYGLRGIYGVCKVKTKNVIAENNMK